MKIIWYYLLLFVFILLLSGYLVQCDVSAMGMPQMVFIFVLLSLYVVAISLVGEGKTVDEREIHHRYRANRAALIAGTAILSAGVLYQLFTYTLDPWLLASLVGINLVKISSLIYSHYRN